MMAVAHPPHTVHREHERSSPPAAARSLRRVYQPIASPWLYLAGLMLVLAITAPFWLGLFETSSSPPVVFPAEPQSSPTPWSRPENEPARRTFSTTPLDQFEGIYLDAPREALERRFAFHRRNTRGMEPEIFEGRGGQGLEWVVMYFYQNRLKEFWAAQPPRVATVDEALRLLRIQYGEPMDWASGEGAPGRSVPGWPLGEAETARYERFGQFRRFLWRDDQHELSVTIHFTTTDPVTCESVVVAHITAHAWLAEHRRKVVSPKLPAGESVPSTTMPTGTPPRWFP